MPANGVKCHKLSVFERSTLGTLCLRCSIYAPIDEIKERGDESGAKRRVQGGAKKSFMSLTSYEGITCRFNWLTENSSQFSSRLAIDFSHRSILLRHLGFPAFISQRVEVKRRDTL